MSVLFANFAGSTLASPIAPGDVTATLTSGGGSLFPSPGAGQYFSMTFANTAATLREIVHVTARSGDVLTIVRAQEGTTALGWNAGDLAQNRLTAGDLAYLEGLFSQTLGGVLTGTLPSPGMAAGAAVANIGFTPVQQGGGAGQGTNKVYLGWDGVAPRIQIDTTDLGDLALRSWVSANFLTLSDFVSGANANGAYYVFPGGMQVCRFSLGSVPANGSSVWTFPLGFPSPPQVFATIVEPPTSTTETLWYSAVTNTSATLFNPNLATFNVNVLAIL